MIRIAIKTRSTITNQVRDEAIDWAHRCPVGMRVCCAGITAQYRNALLIIANTANVSNTRSRDLFSIPISSVYCCIHDSNLQMPPTLNSDHIYKLPTDSKSHTLYESFIEDSTTLSIDILRRKIMYDKKEDVTSPLSISMAGCEHKMHTMALSYSRQKIQT